MSDRLDLWRHGVIEAHAGTGKTHAIVGLVLRLLRERRLSLSEILLVTYTEKAAGELVERIRKSLVEAIAIETDPDLRAHLELCHKELSDSLIGTIHGICLRLLRAWPFESGSSFASELADDDEGLESALRQSLREGTWKPAQAPSELFGQMVSSTSIGAHLEKALALSKLLLDPQVVLEPDGIEDQWDTEDAGAREASFQARWAGVAATAWTERKEREGLLSFQDILSKMSQAVESPTFRQLLREKVRVGIIDEFQDTSRLQWSIFETWFLRDVPETTDREKRPVLFLVGDPKQSIYSFQGADVGAYLEACELMERHHGAQRVSLEENWRSLPALIEACNQILSPRQVAISTGKGKGKSTQVQEQTWFFDPNPRLDYRPPTQARAPRREASSTAALPGDLDRTPVRIFETDLSSGAARTEYARLCAGWIKVLVGTVVSLPKANAWETRVLGWGDFAVVAGSRAATRFFQRELDRARIPWALYKQEGVFRSRAALELRAVLVALHEGPQAAGLWRKALCTRVFDGDEPLLEEARDLALRGSWARLFRHLSTRTGLQGRLLGASQGEREWMDWRQCAAHALDYLVGSKGNLSELSEHLGRLSRREESAQEDRNLHARATDRERVQILTMHASKGLEFPVVFLAEGGVNNRMPTASWIEGGRLHAMPAITTPTAKRDKTPWHESVDRLKEKAKIAQAWERRRLHYVALTRPKLALFAHCLTKRPDPLSEALRPLLDSLPTLVARLDEAPPSAVQPDSGASPAAVAAVHSSANLDALSLPRRVQVLTSYSQIQRESAAHLSLDGRTARSEESDDAQAVVSLADQWLPRGARTGDALHEILESWLDPDQSLDWLLEAQTPPSRHQEVEKILSRHGLARDLSARVTDLLRRVLTTPLDLGEGDGLRLCDLPPQDRRPEVEFHWAFGEDGQIMTQGSRPKGWMVGYIDLLFRHQGCWHVLDWKTTSLSEWSAARVDESMEHHGYRLQADLYRQTVERATPGVPAGRSVYLYLRAFADPATARWGTWVSPPTTENRLEPALRGWLQERHSRLGGRP